MKTLYIVPCGALKASQTCTADALYRGSYHRACLAYALARAERQEVLILSAKHGLLQLSDIIAPYEQRFGQPGAVAAEVVARQAADMDLLKRPVVALGGAHYINMVRSVWPEGSVSTPLTGRGGLFQQIKWLRANARVRAVKQTSG